jgi:uracil-DNA glycosylase family 4
MNYKHQKPDGCNGCVLQASGRGYVPDDVPAMAEIIIRGEAPARVECEVGRPFQGQAGFVLKEWLLKAVPELQVALEKGRVGFSNNLKCWPPEVSGRPYPTGDTKRASEEHCKQYTAWPSSVKTVILCGEHPQRQFFGPELEAEDLTDRQLGREPKGVMGRIGRVYERDGVRWVFAPHPAYILRQPALVGQGQEALRIAANTAKFEDPKVLAWLEAITELN